MTIKPAKPYGGSTVHEMGFIFLHTALCSGKYALNAHVNARKSSCKVLATAVRSETKLHRVYTLSINHLSFTFNKFKVCLESNETDSRKFV